MRLRQHFITKVGGGKDIMRMLCSTATGTGLGSATYHIGQMVLDRAAKDWFLCTATAGSGTWVKLNA